MNHRLVAQDAFRPLKILLGVPMLIGALGFMWFARWNALECANEACIVRHEYLLRPTRSVPFEVQHPPAVVVEVARFRKHDGKRLVLRYDDGSEVELARDFGEGVEARAAGLRAYLASPRGSFSLKQAHEPFPVGLAAFIALLGLLMSLDGMTLAGWQRIRSDKAGLELTIERVLFGLRVKRQTFAISATTTVGREQVASGNPHFYWLTLENPGEPPRRLPVLDYPKSRAIVEEIMLGCRLV